MLRVTAIILEKAVTEIMMENEVNALAFATKMEELLKIVLRDASLATFRLALTPTESGCEGELYLLFPGDLLRLEGLLKEEFLVDNEASKPVHDVEEKGELALATYQFSLKAPRDTLREWRSYSGKICRLQVGTVLQGACDAMNSALGMSGEEEGKTLRKLARMNALLEEAEEGYRILMEQGKGVAGERGSSFFESSGGEHPLQVPSDNGPMTGLSGSDTEKQDPDQQGGQPVPESSDGSRESGLDLASLRLFFNTHAGWLERWEKLARERAIPVKQSAAPRQEEALRNLALLLQTAEVKNLEALEEELGNLGEGQLGLRLDSLRQTFGEEIDTWDIDPFSLIFLVLLDVKWDILKDKDLEGLGIKAAMERIRSSH